MINASIVLYQTPQADTDNIVRVLRASSVVDKIEIIDNEHGVNLGYGGGHNVALRKSIEQGADYHLVVNADVTFEPSVLEDMMRYMDEHPDVALMMPRVTFPNGELQHLCKLLPTPLDVFGRRFLPERWISKRNSRYELRATGYDHIMNVPCLSGCFMLLRVSALKEVGIFDERFFLYTEDIDLSRRLHEKYKTLYYPRQTIIHYYARGSYNNKKLLRVHIVSMCRYFNKWGWFIDKDRRRVNDETLHTEHLS